MQALFRNSASIVSNQHLNQQRANELPVAKSDFILESANELATGIYNARSIQEKCNFFNELYIVSYKHLNRQRATKLPDAGSKFVSNQHWQLNWRQTSDLPIADSDSVSIQYLNLFGIYFGIVL